MLLFKIIGMNKINRNRIARLILALLSIAYISVLVSCKSSSEVQGDYVLLQSDLDQVTDTVKIGITGDTFDSLFAKNNDLKTPLYSSRDIFQNLKAKADSVTTGAIYVRRFYSIPDLDHKYQRTLTKIMIMAKHNRGFFPDGGDWEYAIMDASGVSNTHPNGILPGSILPVAIADTSMAGVAQGKLRVHCGSCHENRKQMGDLFLNQ